MSISGLRSLEWDIITARLMTSEGRPLILDLRVLSSEGWPPILAVWVLSFEGRPLAPLFHEFCPLIRLFARGDPLHPSPLATGTTSTNSGRSSTPSGPYSGSPASRHSSSSCSWSISWWWLDQFSYWSCQYGWNEGWKWEKKYFFNLSIG